MQSYWFSKQSRINIIYNISVITITITMSIILANFGKYAISDCPFISMLCSNSSLYFCYLLQQHSGEKQLLKESLFRLSKSLAFVLTNGVTEHCVVYVLFSCPQGGDLWQVEATTLTKRVVDGSQQSLFNPVHKVIRRQVDLQKSILMARGWNNFGEARSTPVAPFTNMV